MLATVVSQVTMNQEKPVDREKICPLLLRVFCANGRHNPLIEYQRGNVPVNELQMYTWLDCTLRELMSLIKEVNPEARRPGTTFDFSVVFPDRLSNRMCSRDLGNTMNGQRGVDDNKTLQMCKFEIGDFIDVAITVPMGGHVRRPFNAGGPRDFGGRDFGGPRRDRDDFGASRRRDMSPRRSRSPVRR